MVNIAKRNNVAKKFTFIDLFAGIGGIRLAFENAGGKCVFSSEWDSHAQKTYKENFGEQPHGDITKIDIDEIPNFDILCAGFPCQPFSQAGFKKGFADTRGTLFFNIAQIIKAKKPKAFFLENVRGLLKHDDGKTFNVIKKVLEDELGYKFYHKIIKASDYGLPQHRPRLFMVGFLNSSVPFNFPDKQKLSFTLSDVFDGAKVNKEIGFTLRVGGRGSKINDRRNWEHYLVDGKVKRIGVNEGKKLQGFPDNFKFPVSEVQAMKQLGNSVAVSAVHATAAEIAKGIKAWQ
ncbi:cytosine-specific methyltransferase [Actinomycetota bacterium]|nr:cytosine-specific methyltransferase [Actinomycetota bacterium]